ncbi:MAG: radical SAM protein, partial [Acidobacteriota bacterium]
MRLWNPIEHALSASARVAWPVLQFFNRQVAAQTFTPAWAPGPIPKSTERSKPQLGWPRTTDSLCPQCVIETRRRILSGSQSIQSLIDDHTGEIPAHILERDGRILIEKTCPQHGTFTDTLAIDPAFLERIENLFPGRDFKAAAGSLHNHGTSSIQHGRGAVLTIDLTNRCNMMCDPCFMDA